MESNLNPEFEFTTGYVTEEGGPSELVIGESVKILFFNISTELWDHDVGKDESLGHVVFDIRWDYYLKARFLLVYQPFLSLDLCTVERKYNSSGILSMMQREAQYRWKGKEVFWLYLLSLLYLHIYHIRYIKVSMEFSPSGYNDGPTPEEEIQPWTPPQPVGEPATEPPLDELRRRVVPAGHGKLRLNLLYDDNRQELKVFVHEAAGLPGGDLPDPPDPQVSKHEMMIWSIFFPL